MRVWRKCSTCLFIIWTLWLNLRLEFNPLEFRLNVIIKHLNDIIYITAYDHWSIAHIVSTAQKTLPLFSLQFKCTIAQCHHCHYHHQPPLLLSRYTSYMLLMDWFGLVWVKYLYKIRIFLDLCFLPMGHRRWPEKQGQDDSMLNSALYACNLWKNKMSPQIPFVLMATKLT